MEAQEWDQMGESVTNIMRKGGGLPDLQSSSNPLAEVSTQRCDRTGNQPPLGCAEESN